MNQEHIAEEWRAVVGWEGWYSVSNLGRVRRDRPYRRSAGFRRASPTGNGYLSLSLSRNNTTARAMVHTLVAYAFLGPRPAGLEINHKNGVKTDNAASNLEYVTVSENQKHALRIGTRVPVKGEEQPQAKLNSGAVLAIRRRSAGGETIRSLAMVYGVSPTAVRQVIHRTRWKHI